MNLKSLLRKEVLIGAGIGAVAVPLALATEGVTAFPAITALFGMAGGGAGGAFVKSVFSDHTPDPS